MDKDWIVVDWVSHPTLLVDCSFKDIINHIAGMMDYPEEYEHTLNETLYIASQYYGLEPEFLVGLAYLTTLRESYRD